MAWKVADSLTGLGMMSRATGDVDTARSDSGKP